MRRALEVALDAAPAASVLWLGITAQHAAKKPPQWRNLQSNERVQQFNDAAFKAVDEVSACTSIHDTHEKRQRTCKSTQQAAKQQNAYNIGSIKKLAVNNISSNDKAIWRGSCFRPLAARVG